MDTGAWWATAHGDAVSHNLLTGNALHKPYCAKPKSEKSIIYSSKDCVFAKG